MLNDKKKLFWLILFSFLIIPLFVSVISTIHVINFFELSNYYGLALTLSIAFEVGALSALAGLVALDKINKNVVWFIFTLLTLYQIMGNVYASYDFISNKIIENPNLIKNWTELFGFSTDTEDLITVKRIIAIISGAFLPIVSLSFLDLSVDYIKKSTGKVNEESNETKILPIEEKTINEVISEEEKEKIREHISSKIEKENYDESIESHGEMELPDPTESKVSNEIKINPAGKFQNVVYKQ